MLTLYELASTRSIRPLWALRETQLPFETVISNVRPGTPEHTQLLRVSPQGKLPVLVDGDFVLTESIAILNYIAELDPKKRLLPNTSTRVRARLDQWQFFAATEIEAPLWTMEKNIWYYPEQDRSIRQIDCSKRDLRRALSHLEREISQRNFLVDGVFSVADIAIGYVLKWADSRALLQEFPATTGYLRRLVERPAFPSDRYVKK